MQFNFFQSFTEYPKFFSNLFNLNSIFSRIISNFRPLKRIKFQLISVRLVPSIWNEAPNHWRPPKRPESTCRPRPTHVQTNWENKSLTQSLNSQTSRNDPLGLVTSTIDRKEHSAPQWHPSHVTKRLISTKSIISLIGRPVIHPLDTPPGGHFKKENSLSNGMLEQRLKIESHNPRVTDRSWQPMEKKFVGENLQLRPATWPSKEPIKWRIVCVPLWPFIEFIIGRGRETSVALVLTHVSSRCRISVPPPNSGRNGTHKKTSDRGRTRADLLPGTSALPTILLTRFFFFFSFFRFSWAPQISCCNTLSYSEFHPDWSFRRPSDGGISGLGCCERFFFFYLSSAEANVINGFFCWTQSAGVDIFFFFKFKCLFWFFI